MPFEWELVIGRTAPLATLSTGLDAALAGRGGLLFFVGEPGAGKSTLVRELADRARAAGAGVLVGRAVESAVPVAQERTRGEFAELVGAAGFGLERVVPTHASVVEALPV